MTIQDINSLAFNWTGLPSLSQFLSLKELAQLRATCHRWSRLLDHPSMRKIVRERLQREWWVTCSLEKLQQGFGAMQREVDGGLRFPYKVQKIFFASSHAIRDFHFGNHFLAGVDLSRTLHIAGRKQKALQISLESSLQVHSPVCAVDEDTFVANTKTHTFLLKPIEGERVKFPLLGRSVFRWSEHQVVFVKQEKEAEELRFCSVQDSQFKFEKEKFYSTSKIRRVVPCSASFGVINTQNSLYGWYVGQKKAVRIETVVSDVDWDVLSLGGEKFVTHRTLDACVKLWDIQTCHALGFYAFTSDLKMAQLPNASFLLYAHNQKQSVVVDPSMPKPILAFSSPEKGFTGAIWMEHGPYFVTSCGPNIHFWDWRRKQILQSMQLPEAVSSLARMRSGDLCAKDPFNRYLYLLTPPSVIKNI